MVICFVESTNKIHTILNAGMPRRGIRRKHIVFSDFPEEICADMHQFQLCGTRLID